MVLKQGYPDKIINTEMSKVKFKERDTICRHISP